MRPSGDGKSPDQKTIEASAVLAGIEPAADSSTLNQPLQVSNPESQDPTL